VVLLVIAVVALWYPLKTIWPIGLEEWKGDDGNRFLAASLSIPLIVLGALLVLAGAWLAIVEWRGRLKSKDELTATGLPDVGPWIEAIGKLRAPALLLVVGAILMLGSAWIASNAAKPTPTSASSGSSSDDQSSQNDDDDD
jgi:hypothetical protein